MQETSMSYICCDVKPEPPSGKPAAAKEGTVENLLGLLGTLNRTLTGIEAMLEQPNIQNEFKQLNMKQWQKTTGTLLQKEETGEKQTQKQLEKLRGAIQDSKEKLSDSLNFLIDSLTK